MRLITKESIQAFNNGLNFKKSNMEIKVISLESGIPCQVQMFYQGNMIAERHTNKRTNKLYISNCGWFSNTTKERLNALNGVSLYQKNFIWYLNGEAWDGEIIEIK